MKKPKKYQYYQNEHQRCPFILFYGSLRRGLWGNRELQVSEWGKYRGTLVIQGSLYDLGSYPGLVMGQEGEVICEIFELLAWQGLRSLDAFEDYHPDSIHQSLYIRKLIWLPQSDHTAWVYVYNGSVKGKSLVSGGDWTAYYQH